MSMDLSGIHNINEYYTNHYLATVFAENVKDRISAWRDQAREAGETTPWARLREVSRRYYVLKERYSRERRVNARQQLLMEFAELLLESLGYQVSNHTQWVQVDEEVRLPILLEVKKPNGAPLLWTMLSDERSADQNLLQGEVLSSSWKKENGEWTVEIEKSNEGIAEDIAVMDYENLLSKHIFSQDEPPRWVILLDMERLALIDRNKWNEKRLLEFDLDEIFGRHEESTLQAMAVLLNKECVCPIDGLSLLDTLSDNSHKHASGVSEDLKYALRECIELLGNEAVYDMKERQHVAVYDKDLADQLTLECLRYMYRILFLLFIEARPELGYAPMKSAEYLKGYSLESLREIIDNMPDDCDEVNNGTYLHRTLNQLFDLIYNGYPESGNDLKFENNQGKLNLDEYKSIHGTFTIQPLKAHIFDPERTPLLNKVRFRNKTLLKAIELMSISRPRKGKQRRGRISYTELGINQLGAVYEALLSYRGFFAEEKLYEVKRAGTNPDELEVGYFVTEAQLGEYNEDERVREADGSLKTYAKGTFIYRLAGRERQKSASYYTPEVLTKCLVKYALKELLQDKTADEILELTICEPAMGSAAFLNEAVSQLAEAYLQLKQKESGERITHDKYSQELQKVKMFIADRNVYGIDLNPVAVELAEVSLWLNSIYAGSFVPWFGTQLKCGNSLIGARRQVYTIDQITAAKAPKIWHANAPERVMPGSKRNEKKQVYHFLLGDPGMSDYTDKIIKELAGDQIKKIRDWRKLFISSLDSDEAKTLLRLSKVIDDLWTRHTEMRRQIDEMTTDDLPVFGREEKSKHKPSTTAEKDNIYKRLYLTEGMQNAGSYARLKFAMDYWCALWFWPIDKAELLPSRKEYLLDMSLILEGGVMNLTSNGQLSLFEDEAVQMAFELFNDIPEVNLDMLCNNFPRLQTVKELADRYKFLHWELEFADVFADRGGFDLVVGNPPWLDFAWFEQDVLGDINPIFPIKNYSASSISNELRYSVLGYQINLTYYLEAYEEISGTQRFLSSIQNYPYLIKQRSNLYKYFIPQAWMLNSIEGISAFLHPNSIFEDPKGGSFRELVYQRIKYHFQFRNELKLFPIGNTRNFGINIYGLNRNRRFTVIVNLFHPSTIDECFNDNGLHSIPEIKDNNGNWEIKGHKDRMLIISDKELKLFANIYDDDIYYRKARLPIIHSKPQLSALHKINEQKNKLANYGDLIYPSDGWNETNAPRDRIIERRTSFPEKMASFIYSGPHLYVGNPLYKCPRENCRNHRDYEVIDLENIDDNYIPRTNYIPSNNLSMYREKSGFTPWGNKELDNYRIAIRRMVVPDTERTLSGAIIGKKAGHIDGVYSLSFRNCFDLVFVSGLISSIPYDFFVKTTGKSNLRYEIIGRLPIPETKTNMKDSMSLRSLLLNCLTISYSELWNKCWKDSYPLDCWTKKDKRLDNGCFKNLSSIWNWETPLRTEYKRRQCLIEIDVLTAMALNINLGELINMYKMQFPVMANYDKDTWYDSEGKIIFTNNSGGLSGVGLDRKRWEEAKVMESGSVTKTFIDDTMPGGPVERTIEYVAPFDRCNREQDYETAWHHFEQRFAQAGKGDEQ